MPEYKIVVDVWEGQLEVDEDVFKQAGVEGMLIRLNDINGAQHKDEGFDKQWREAGDKGFLRAPYFVYSPWYSGQANFDWLMANKPADTTMVMADVEVIKAGYDKKAYADEVDFFTYLLSKESPMKMYTGPWFLPNMTYWPKTVGYVWARYPNVMYPPTTEYWTWAKLKDTVSYLSWPVQYAEIGPIELWQCSGDRLILPGNAHILDICLWPKSSAELAVWFGVKAPTPTDDRVMRLEQQVQSIFTMISDANTRMSAAELKVFDLTSKMAELTGIVQAVNELQQKVDAMAGITQAVDDLVVKVDAISITVQAIRDL